MNRIDKLADRNNGHYVVPKAPLNEKDEQMRLIIAQMKKNSTTLKAK